MRDPVAPPDRSSACPVHDSTSVAPSAVRWAYAVLGVGCFGLGAIGAVVPGMPTTIFLLVGSYLLTRSCPWLERRLREIPLLKPYTKYLDPSVPMPWPAKKRSIAAMWISIVFATSLLAWRDAVPAAVLAAIPLAGVAGTWVILRFRRELETESR